MQKKCKRGEIDINGECFDKDLFSKKAIRDVDIGHHYYSFKADGDEMKLSLGNFTDAGWYWDGDEMDLAGFLIRMQSSKVRDNFIEGMKEAGITVEQIREMLIRSIQSNNGLYEISGDNRKWRFGDDDEYLIEEEINYYAEENDLSDKEKEELEEFFWRHSKSNSADYDTFEKSDEAREVKKALIDAATHAGDWDDLFDELKEAQGTGIEMSYEFSNEENMNELMRITGEWTKEKRRS